MIIINKNFSIQNAHFRSGKFKNHFLATHSPTNALISKVNTKGSIAGFSTCGMNGMANVKSANTVKLAVLIQQVTRLFLALNIQ